MSSCFSPNHAPSWSASFARAFAALVVFIISVGTLTAAQPANIQRTTTNTVKTFRIGTGSEYWDVGTNWDPQGEPQDGDHVIIPDAAVCRVRTSDAHAESIEVQEGGLLLIHNQLTIDDDSEVVDNFGVELVREHRTDPEVPTLVINGDVTLSGSGSIQGKESDARIVIPPYRCLVNEAKIEGTLHIVGTQTVNNFATNLAQGTFANGGIIEANAPGNLVIQSTIALTNHTTSGEWKVALNASARLIVAPAWASPLNDSFELVLGTLQISTPIMTSGDLRHNGGLLDVRADLTLHHSGFPEWRSLYTFNGGSGNVACEVTFAYDDFVGTQENPDNTKDEDPPFEVVGPPCGG